MNLLIIDGYVDEPANLGVPPYISTYPRYLAGASVEAGIKEDNINYITIDQLRNQNYQIEYYDFIVIVGGTTVPGKYLGGKPIQLFELEKILKFKSRFKLLGGPIKFGYTNKGRTKAVKINFDESIYISNGDIEKDLFVMLTKIQSNAKNLPLILNNYRTVEEINRWSVAGAFIIKKHPDFPYVISEIETFRGCERKYHCSYCTEFFYGLPIFRDQKDILNELKALKKFGENYIRIGRQSNILGYKGIITDRDFRKPNVYEIENLFFEINKLNFKVVHIDNVNPGTIVNFPEESLRALSIIATYDTAGDIAAMGYETLDNEVKIKNNLKISYEDAMLPIEIVNKAGNFKVSNRSVPKLLPGLNFLSGLYGETRNSYKVNIKFLEEILKTDFLVRRVNIRQVMIFPGTALEKFMKKVKTKYYKDFKHFKYWVRHVFDKEMIKRVFPYGTIIKNIKTEKYNGDITLGREIGTYPITVRFYEKLPLKKMYNAIIVGHKERSIEAVRYPVDLNKMDYKALKKILPPSIFNYVITNRPIAVEKHEKILKDLNLN